MELALFLNSGPAFHVTQLKLIFSAHVSLQNDNESWAEEDKLADDDSSVDKPQGKMNNQFYCFFFIMLNEKDS